ncbi:MAG: CopG family ribbon-helix-helix protein [Thermoplasmata archaeon]|nr:CopG family ribbon-helix-helix protein [Thermoplasmata archaeon]
MVLKPVGVVRFAISLPPGLAHQLDAWVAGRNSRSRSDAIRFLVRRALAEDTSPGDPNSDALAAVLLLYRHSAPHLLERLTKAQHRWGEHVRSSVHVHLEGDACAELLLLTGRRGELERASADLRGVKGLRDARWVLALPSVAEGRTGHRHPHRATHPAQEGAHRPAHGAPSARRTKRGSR